MSDEYINYLSLEEQEIIRKRDKENKYNVPPLYYKPRKFNFDKGNTIKSMNELVELCCKNKQSVWFHESVVNYAWVRNQQLWFLERWVESGAFKIAIKKEKNKKG